VLLKSNDACIWLGDLPRLVVVQVNLSYQSTGNNGVKALKVQFDGSANLIKELGSIRSVVRESGKLTSNNVKYGT
jgi:hypothetical protein